MADEIIAVLVSVSPSEALVALRRERERREREHLPALTAALIPCADERQATRAVGAFRVVGDFSDTVLTMFNAARTDLPGSGDGRAAFPTPS